MFCNFGVPFFCNHILKAPNEVNFAVLSQPLSDSIMYCWLDKKVNLSLSFF